MTEPPRPPDATPRAHPAPPVDAERAHLAYRLLDDAPGGFALLGRDWRVLYVNRTGAAGLGTTVDAIVGRGLWETFPEAVGGIFHDTYRRAMDERVVADAEAEYAPLGKWFRVQAFPVDEGIGVHFDDVTERRQRQAALEQARRELDEAQAVARIGSWSWDVATGRVTWSPQVYALLGLDPDRFTPDFSRIPEVVSAEDWPRMQRALEAALAERAPYDIRLAMRHAGGRQLIVHARAELVRDAAGAVTGLFGTMQDVTEQALLERERDESRRALFRAQRLARLQPWHLDLGTGLHDVPDAVDLFGMGDRAPTTTDGFFALVHPDDLPRLEQAFADALDGRAPHYEARFRARHGDGTWHHYHSVAEVDRDAGGRPGGLTGVTRDRTDSVAAEVALAASEARFRTLAETAPVGIFLADADGGHLYVNPALVRIWQRDPAEVAGLGWMRFLHPDDAERVVGTIRSELQRGRPATIRTRILLADGSVRTLRAVVAPIPDPSGIGIAGAVGIVEDTTDELAAIEARQKLERQMQQAQKLESLGVLAGGIAHDFNNLLVGILGNASLALMECPAGAPVRSPLQDIERAAQRAAELTRQLLAYSGKGRFVVEPLDLTAVAEEMIGLLRTAISKKAELRLGLARDLPAIEADATQVRQVVMNLITNASDALRDEPGTIFLRTGRQHVDATYRETMVGGEPLPEGDYVFVEVSDTGEGMDPAVVPRIFEPFYTTKFTGRGLGLAATLGIVRGHGGAIRVYTERGKGSTFKLLFPAGQRAAGASGATATHALQGGGTILIVDDEPSVRAVTRALLVRAGFEVLEAGDGEDAVALFRRERERIRAVLLDLTMPRMDGEETFRQLRLLDPAVRVLLMSGYNEQNVTNQFVGKGLAGFVQKPFGADELYARVAQVLQR